MVVDLAHSNERAFWDVMSIAKRPVIDSHTGFRRFWNHPRNLDDAQLDAIARSGGVVCIDFVPDHIKDRPDRGVPVAIADVVEVISYAVERVGAEHVGLGADWDGFDETISGLEDVTGVPRLAPALAEKGLEDGEIALVMGGSLRRLLGSLLP